MLVNTIFAAAIGAVTQSPIQPAQVLNFIHPPLRGRDAPGLSCRALVNGDWVYADRSTTSHRLGFQRNAVAVTGPEVDGFVPVLVATGQHGWMLAKVMQLREPTNYTPLRSDNQGENGATIRMRMPVDPRRA